MADKNPDLKSIVDSAPDWRAYTAKDRIERERVGSPMTPKVREKKLTPAECAVVISIDILSKAGIPTTPKKIADFLKEDVQTVRNILERLRKKGLVISSLAFGLGGFPRISTPSQASASERTYRLVDDIENILQQHPEILDWAKVSLGIKDKNELIEYLARISTPSQASGREKIHRLVDDIENILQQHPEILDWAKVSLGIKDKNELIEYINKLAAIEYINKLAEEVRLESYKIPKKDLVKKSGE
jgi:predicted ArsR family transcriptional regulator